MKISLEVIRNNIVFRIVISYILTILLFLIINITHFKMLGAKVILYTCIIDAILACVIQTIVMFFICKNDSKMVIALTAWSTFLIIMLYSILVPTLVDRSLSIYVLRTVSRAEGSVKLADFDGLLQKGYFREMDVTNQRIIEQTASGTIIIKGEDIQLTRKGRLIISLAGIIERYFLPNDRTRIDMEAQLQW